jgi:hypothetical protein
LPVIAIEQKYSVTKEIVLSGHFLNLKYNLKVKGLV